MKTETKNKQIEKLGNASSNIAQLDKQLISGGKIPDIAIANSQPIVTVSYVRAHIKFRQGQGYQFTIEKDSVKMIGFKKS